MNRCSQILIITVMILIMSGGILLTDNNIRDLQGREKPDISIAAISETIPDKNLISSSIKDVYLQGRDRAVYLFSWLEKVSDTCSDVIKGIGNTVKKLLPADSSSVEHQETGNLQ
ncbi:MAG: hypothetical protein PHV50_09630 [Syntrophaceticus sp.]|nr:hypothetical protein [Syntrophaceticus sp.]